VVSKWRSILRDLERFAANTLRSLRPVNPLFRDRRDLSSLVSPIRSRFVHASNRSVFKLFGYDQFVIPASRCAIGSDRKKSKGSENIIKTASPKGGTSGELNLTRVLSEIERVTVPSRVTSTNWKRLNRGKSKPGQGTMVNRIFHQQVSTPAMQKSTARLTYNSRYATTSTTADPRAPLIKDHGFKHNRNDNPQDLKDHSRASAIVVSERIVLSLCLILFSTVR